jgi:hypothetical protein
MDHRKQRGSKLLGIRRQSFPQPLHISKGEKNPKDSSNNVNYAPEIQIDQKT